MCNVHLLCPAFNIKYLKALRQRITGMEKKLHYLLLQKFCYNFFRKKKTNFHEHPLYLSARTPLTYLAAKKFLEQLLNFRNPR